MIFFVTATARWKSALGPARENGGERANISTYVLNFSTAPSLGNALLVVARRTSRLVRTSSVPPTTNPQLSQPRDGMKNIVPKEAKHLSF